MVKKEESRDFDVFFFFFFFLFLFGGGEKSLKFVQAEHRTKGVFFFFLVWRCLGPFYSPDTLYEERMPPSNGLRWG